MLKFLLLILTLYSINATLIFEWKTVDLQFPSPEVRQRMIEDQSFITEDINIRRVAVYEDKLFIQLYQARGAPLSLAYVNLTDTSTKSPILIPYPSWSAHFDTLEESRLIHDVMAIRVDRCHRLWVLDRINEGYLTHHALIIFDLATDQIIKRHKFSNPGYRIAMAIEDANCGDTYAFTSDDYSGDIWVYSLKKNETRCIPGDKISSMIFTSNSIYYNKGKDVFYVATEKLRKSANVKDFERKSDISADLLISALDTKRNILYYANKYCECNDIHTVCWDATKPCDRHDWRLGNYTTFQVTDLILNKDTLYVLEATLSFRSEVQYKFHSVSLTEKL
ncbi:protein yellow-like [Aricia agestis]|uniref:protein yellow-like n=1 Tax=Aricia agestis TaxID=91739 RepID=UPI001C20C34E|nr:protein yellow-like [Aricia agestis]